MSTIRFDNELMDVREFCNKFGQLNNTRPVHLTRRKLWERVDFLQEELDELSDAVKAQDLAGIADALVDLVYVAKGTVVMLGLPWELLWAEVQRSNMAKVAGVGKRGHLVDCVKPEGWVSPQLAKILKQAGYDPNDQHNEEVHQDDAVYKP